MKALCINKGRNSPNHCGGYLGDNQINLVVVSFRKFIQRVKSVTSTKTTLHSPEEPVNYCLFARPETDVAKKLASLGWKQISKMANYWYPPKSPSGLRDGKEIAVTQFFCPEQMQTAEELRQKLTGMFPDLEFEGWEQLAQNNNDWRPYLR